MERIRTTSGFSMVELLLIVGVVGLLAAIALPRIDRTRYIVDSGAQSVATTLAAAQRAALTQEHDIAVSFDTTNRQISILYDSNNDGVAGATERVRRLPLEPILAFGRAGATARPMGSAAINLTASIDGLPAVIFHRNGTASSAGGLYLTSKRAVSDSAYRKDTRALEIVRATGRTEWLRYTGTAWKRGF